MGWALGEYDGRDIGYAVQATCDKPGCETEIDRGFSYACGDTWGDGENHRGETMCAGYFCEEHRYEDGHDCEGEHTGKVIKIETVENQPTMVAS